jgi:predicted RNA-binding Zn-ribbon protein involved in translation (DUF1610 family)
MTSEPELPTVEFSSGRRIAAGIGWGLLWGGGISVVIFPIFPTNFTLIFVICCIVLTTLTLGISLYWNAAREPCPSCGTIFTATPNGSRCPSCGQQVRASDRKMVLR